MKRPTVINYAQNDLFRAADPYHLNACVGWNGGPHGYETYAEGYFAAAEQLCKAAIRGDEYIDLLIYPVAFNFRHAIELAIKGLLLTLPAIWGETAPLSKTHKLLDNWNLVKGYLKREPGLNPDGSAIDRIDGILKDFLSIDPEGQSFRYPVSIKGEMHLEKVSCINLVVLAEAIEYVGSVFDAWDFLARELLDQAMSSRS